MNACDGLGFALLKAGRPADAVTMFRRALGHYPDHARSLVGLGQALAHAGDQAEAAVALEQASAAIDALRRGGRAGEARLAEAFVLTARGRTEEAVETMNRLLEESDLPFTGWTIPIEPLLDPLRRSPLFRDVLNRLAARAT